jgi:hypothetical protein
LGRDGAAALVKSLKNVVPYESPPKKLIFATSWEDAPPCPAVRDAPNLECPPPPVDPTPQTRASEVPAFPIECMPVPTATEGQSEVVRGFMDFPTHPPAEDVLAGNAQIRVTDIHMWNAPAGDGKSVGMSQISMAWALKLPYCGIYPSRPLKIIHFCGEDGNRFPCVIFDDIRPLTLID